MCAPWKKVRVIFWTEKLWWSGISDNHISKKLTCIFFNAINCFNHTNFKMFLETIKCIHIIQHINSPFIGQRTKHLTSNFLDKDISPRLYRMRVYVYLRSSNTDHMTWRFRATHNRICFASFYITTPVSVVNNSIWTINYFCKHLLFDALNEPAFRVMNINTISSAAQSQNNT